MAAPLRPSGSNYKADKLWSDAIRLAALEAHKKGDPKKLRLAATKLVDKAVEGDIGAMKEMGDRLDGKPAQALEHSGPSGEPLQTHGVLVVPATVTMEQWVEQARRLQKPPE